MKKFPSASLRLLTVRALKIALVAAVAGSAAASVCAPAASEPDFTLVAGANPAPLAPGATGSVDFQITPINGFNNNLTVELNDNFGLLRDGESDKAKAVPQAGSAKAVQVDNFATVTRLNLPAGATSAHVVFQVNADATAGVHTLELAVFYGSDFDKKGHVLSVPVTVTAPLPSSYSLSVQTAPLTVAANSTSPTDNVTITRSNFTGAITLSGAGETGSGITVNVTGQPGTGSQGTFTVTVPPGLAPRTYQVTLTARATGLVDVTTSFAVVVPAVSYSFNVQTAPLTVVAGGPSQADIVTINRTNFTGGITVTGTSDPGITITADLTPVTGNQTSITVAATSGVSAGTHTVTLKGVAAGLPDYTTTFAGVVQAPSTNTTWTFCPTTGLPLWVAVQDGPSPAPWSRVTSTNNAYPFQIASAKGGIAYVIYNGQFYELHVLYGSQAELQTQGAALCGNSGATKMVNGSVSNTGTAATAFISLGSAVNFLSLPATTFPLIRVPPGTLDLVAATVDGASPPNPTKMLVRRNINAADASTLSALDFTGSEAFVPQSALLTLASSLGQQVNLEGFFHTRNSAMSVALAGNDSLSHYYSDNNSSAATSRTIFGVPPANQIAGDLHYLSALANGNGSGAVPYRTQGVVFGAVAAKTLTFGSALNAPLFSKPTGFVERAALPVQAEYNKLWQADYDQISNAGRFARVQVTAAYLGATGTANIDLPDLSTVAGWLSTYGLLTGTPAAWRVTASSWSTAGITFVQFIDGATFTSATAQGTVTP